MTKIKGKKAPVSARILHDPQVCTGCGLCDLMCSLYHEGEQGQALSRAELVGDRLTAEFTFNVCRQCPSPSCYDACPLKDKALCIDEVTGVKYINAEECDGCGECIEACPFDPSRIKLHVEKNVAFPLPIPGPRDPAPVTIETLPSSRSFGCLIFNFLEFLNIFYYSKPPIVKVLVLI